ncbi:hypothetical protein PT974_09567 [Cladobotryum mycophilum]|uniref:Uncharacterized protein n=1 Tax=Cladobotryum mycophilum TaxID=491253 RepID=A0ABR0SGJ2_9HYPO
MSGDTNNPESHSTQVNGGSDRTQDGTSSANESAQQRAEDNIQSDISLMLLRWFEESPKDEPFHGMAPKDPMPSSQQ